MIFEICMYEVSSENKMFEFPDGYKIIHVGCGGHNGTPKIWVLQPKGGDWSRHIVLKVFMADEPIKDISEHIATFTMDDGKLAHLFEMEFS